MSESDATLHEGIDPEAVETTSGADAPTSGDSGGPSDGQPKTWLDKIEQIAKILATAMIPIIVAIGGWVIQTTIEHEKDLQAEALTESQRASEKDKVALEYVKLAKDILTSQKHIPEVLVKWSWQLIDKESPRPFDPEDLQSVISNSIKIPVSPPASDGGNTSDQISSSPLAQQASTEALNLLIQGEVGSKTGYENSLAHPRSNYPGGVVIGFGYDLAYVTKEQFQDAWGPHLGSEAMKSLLPAIGVRDQDTTKSLVANLSSVFFWDAAVAVFLSTTLPEVYARLKSSVPNVDLLPPESHGALLDLAYNVGIAFSLAGDRYLEMRAIRDKMANKQFSEIPALIRSMKRYYVDHPGLSMRRELEAVLFEKGLSSPKAASAETEAVPAGARPTKQN